MQTWESEEKVKGEPTETVSTVVRKERESEGGRVVSNKLFSLGSWGGGKQWQRVMEMRSPGII